LIDEERMDSAADERALLSMLGLAARARATVVGTDAARAAIRDGKAGMVLLAADASPTQRRKLVPLMEARRVPFRDGPDRDALGAAMGRGPVSAVAVTEPSLARRILEMAADRSHPQDVHEESRTDASI
jgi:ribosomal protein L7Ae-like RNA K-turn-binding protein